MRGQRSVDVDLPHSGLAASPCSPPPTSTTGVNEILATHRQALDTAYAVHPERFVSGPPIVKPQPRR